MTGFNLKTLALTVIFALLAGLGHAETTLRERILQARNRPNPTIVRIKIRKALKRKQAIRKAQENKVQERKAPPVQKQP